MRVFLEEGVDFEALYLSGSIISDRKVKTIEKHCFYCNCDFQTEITSSLNGNNSIYFPCIIEEDDSIQNIQNGVRIIDNETGIVLAVILYPQEAVILNRNFMNTIFNKYYEEVIYGADAFQFFVAKHIKFNNIAEDNSVTIGLDIEFEQTESEKDYSVIEATIEDPCYDAVIGKDGSGNQIEIRPKSSDNYEILTNNLRNLISIAPIPLSVIGDVYPLGAHIHFGLPESLRTMNNYRQCSILLDKLLGEVLFYTNSDLRQNSMYGRLTQYRPKPYGFEYRSLTSAFVIDIDMTKLILKIAHNAIKYFVENRYVDIPEPDEIDYEFYKKVCGITEEEYQKLIEFPSIFNNIKYNIPTINKIWKQSAPIYVKLASSIIKIAYNILG